jgi:hypothetical protein
LVTNFKRVFKLVTVWVHGVRWLVEGGLIFYCEKPISLETKIDQHCDDYRKHYREVKKALGRPLFGELLVSASFSLKYTEWNQRNQVYVKVLARRHICVDAVQQENAIHFNCHVQQHEFEGLESGGQSCPSLSQQCHNALNVLHC